jgi:hypothetical protein
MIEMTQAELSRFLSRNGVSRVCFDGCGNVFVTINGFSVHAGTASKKRGEAWKFVGPEGLTFMKGSGENPIDLIPFAINLAKIALKDNLQYVKFTEETD